VSLEEQLRAVLREHDVLAPTPADLGTRPWHRPSPPRWRPWMAVASAAAFVLALAIGVAVLRPHPGRSAPPVHRQVLACPHRYHTGTSVPWVPAPPNRAGARDRLAPPVTPTGLLVCAYVGPREPAPRGPADLTGSRQLTGDLSRAAATLSLLPRLNPAARVACTANRPKTDDDYDLFGLTYPTGTVWISAPGDHCGGSGNGQFRSSANLLRFAIAALSSGRWITDPPPVDGAGHPVANEPGDKRCTPALTGRLGDDRHLVPDGATQVTICGITDAPKTLRTTHDVAGLIQALNTKPTRPSRGGCTGSPDFAGSYDLIFGYSFGPAQEVMILAGCSPEVDNGSLQAADGSTALSVIGRLLGHR
jgi:hypothetical protein